MLDARRSRYGSSWTTTGRHFISSYNSSHESSLHVCIIATKQNSNQEKIKVYNLENRVKMAVVRHPEPVWSVMFTPSNSSAGAAVANLLYPYFTLHVTCYR